MKRLIAAVVALAASASLAGGAATQSRGPVRDYAAIYGARNATTPSAPPAVQAAYGERAGDAVSGEGRPPPRRGDDRNYGYSDYGRVNAGRHPEYGDPAFNEAARPKAAATEETAAEEEAEDEGDEDEFGVAEGFFFDNYTSGTGFGVYGGEAVTSGPGDARLALPSAGQTARELGLLPDGYAQAGREEPAQ